MKQQRIQWVEIVLHALISKYGKGNLTVIYIYLIS